MGEGMSLRGGCFGNVRCSCWGGTTVGCAVVEKDGFNGILHLLDVFFLKEDGEMFPDDEFQCRLAFGSRCLGLDVVARRKERQEFGVVEVLVGLLLPFGEELLDLISGEELDGVGGTLDDFEVAVDVDEVAAGLDAVDDVDGLSFAFEGHLAGLAGLVAVAGRAGARHALLLFPLPSTMFTCLFLFIIEVVCNQSIDLLLMSVACCCFVACKLPPPGARNMVYDGMVVVVEEKVHMMLMCSGVHYSLQFK